MNCTGRRKAEAAPLHEEIATDKDMTRQFRLVGIALLCLAAILAAFA